MTQKTNKKLDQKINQITTTYKQLQKTQFFIVKKTLIGSLTKLCLQGLEIVDQQKVTPEIMRKKKQIDQMLKKCKEIEGKLDSNEMIKPQIGSSNRTHRIAMNIKNQKPQSDQEQLQQRHLMKEKLTSSVLHKKSQQVAKSIIFYQMQSQNIKITTQELDELAKRIQTNNEVMKQIQLMVQQQGGDLDKIQDQIKQTYNMVKNANVELEKAAEIQHKNRILKIRLGMSGFLAAFGLKILGLPGMIFGFFSGMIVGR